jgi:hypothetical protein
VATDPSTITLHKVAPWNPALRNTYRERFTQVGTRMFMVRSGSLNGFWHVEEVNADGDHHIRPEGWKYGQDMPTAGPSDIVQNLHQARASIAAMVDGSTDPGRDRHARVMALMDQRSAAFREHDEAECDRISAELDAIDGRQQRPWQKGRAWGRGRRRK